MSDLRTESVQFVNESFRPFCEQKQWFIQQMTQKNDSSQIQTLNAVMWLKSRKMVHFPHFRDTLMVLFVILEHFGAQYTFTVIRLQRVARIFF